MFNGIIEAQGQLKEILPLQSGLRILIDAPKVFRDDTPSGASIAVDGACLTVVDWQADAFSADVSPETLEKTTLDALKVGDRVNLERAIRFSDRLNGHCVTGHIDGVGKITEIETQGAFSKFVFEISESQGLIVDKGSIAIDGISLTVNGFEDNKVEVMIIPETLKRTTLGNKKVGDAVQIEFDILGKYVKQQMERK